MVNLSENMDLYKEVGEKSFEGVSSLGQININAWQKITQKQMEILSLATEASLNSLQSFTNKPGIEHISENQAEITRQFGEKINGKGQELLEISTTLRDEYIAFTEEQLSSLNLNFNHLGR